MDGIFTYGNKPLKHCRRLIPISCLNTITVVFGKYFTHLSMHYLEAADSERNAAAPAPVELSLTEAISTLVGIAFFPTA